MASLDVTKEYMDNKYPNWTKFYFGSKDSVPVGMLCGPADGVPLLNNQELAFVRGYNKENRTKLQSSTHVNLKEITIDTLDNQSIDVTRALAYVKLSNCQDIANVLKSIGKEGVIPVSVNNYDKLTHKDIKTMAESFLKKYTKYIFTKSNNYSEIFTSELESNKGDEKFVSDVKKAMEENNKRKEARKNKSFTKY